MDIDLDFEKGTSNGTQRLNYRFDAVAAVRIDGTGSVLEGIAAEGKEWIRRQRQQADHRLTDLTATVRGLID